MGELESRVEPLKKQSEKAQKFITLSDEKKTLEIGVWVNKINRFTNELREQEHKIDAANASYDICEKELKAIEEEIEEIAQKPFQSIPKSSKSEWAQKLMRKKHYAKTVKLRF